MVRYRRGAKRWGSRSSSDGDGDVDDEDGDGGYVILACMGGCIALMMVHDPPLHQPTAHARICGLCAVRCAISAIDAVPWLSGAQRLLPHRVLWGRLSSPAMVAARLAACQVGAALKGWAHPTRKDARRPVPPRRRQNGGRWGAINDSDDETTSDDED